MPFREKILDFLCAIWMHEDYGVWEQWFFEKWPPYVEKYDHCRRCWKKTR